MCFYLFNLLCLHREIQTQGRNKCTIQFGAVKVTHHHISQTRAVFFFWNSLGINSGWICNNFILFISGFMKGTYLWNPQRWKSTLFFLQKTFYLATPTALTRPHSFNSQHLLMQTKSPVCLPQAARLACSVSGICIQRGDVQRTAEPKTLMTSQCFEIPAPSTTFHLKEVCGHRCLRIPQL